MLRGRQHRKHSPKMTSTTASVSTNSATSGSSSDEAARTMDVIRDCSPTRPKLVKCSERHPKSVLENFASLRRQGELCDVTLLVGSTRIHAHKIVLCASSPYFRAMFTSELAEAKQAEITIKDIDENAMEILVDFCYSAKITIDEKIVQNLLPAACLLQVYLTLSNLNSRKKNILISSFVFNLIFIPLKNDETFNKDAIYY